MSSQPTSRVPGQSISNVRVKNAGKKVINAFRVSRGLPSDVAVEEIDGEKLRVYMGWLCMRLSETAIPAGGADAFDEELKPTNPNNKRCLKSSAMEQYIIQHLQDLKECFPDHPCFVKGSKQNPAVTTVWWGDMRRGFVSDCEKFQMSFGDDVVFGLEPIRPIYKDAGLPMGSVTCDPMAKIDLKRILLHLVKNASANGDNLMKRLTIQLTSDCIARGGEVRYQNYDDWTWHPFIELLDVTWKEMKTIHNYGMGVVPDLCHWVFDIYHCLASYFAVEKGLFRTNDDISKGLLNVAFPLLHKTGENRTTTKITEAIRSALPDSIGDKIKTSVSARSLRQGAINEMAMHGCINVFEACARSGHSTGTTLDEYLDEKNALRGLKAAMARCCYKNLTTDLDRRIHVPRLSSLGGEALEYAMLLMDDVFLVSVPHFQQQGKLRAVLAICMATLILYHPQVAKECGGGNIICKALNESARRVKIKDLRFPEHSPEALLLEWSTIIADDLTKRRSDDLQAKPDLVSIAATLNQTLAMVTELVNTVHSLERNNAHLESKFAAQSSELATLRDESIRSAAKINMVFRTPPPAVKKRKFEVMMKVDDDDVADNADDGCADSSNISEEGNKKLPPEEALEEEDDDDDDYFPMEDAPESGDEMEEPSAEVTAAIKVEFAADIPAPPASLKKLGRCRDIEETMFYKGARKEVGSILLRDLLSSNRHTLLQSDLKNSPVPPGGVTEKWCVTYCYELIQYVVERDEEAQKLLATLKNAPEKDRKQYLEAAAALERKAMDQMLVFEGKNPAVERQLKKKQCSSKYRGLGERLNAYKTKLITAQGKTTKEVKQYQQKLCLMDELEVVAGKPQAPKGNMLLTNLWHKLGGTSPDKPQKDGN